jgi:hypothetical protein
MGEIEQNYINDCCFSTLINPLDIKEILKNHNEMLLEIKKFEDSSSKLQLDNDGLK